VRMNGFGSGRTLRVFLTTSPPLIEIPASDATLCKEKN